MSSFNIDPEQAIPIVAVFLFIDAAWIGFPLLSALINGVVFANLLLGALLVAGLITGGVGLLKGRSWAWYLALAVAVLHLLLAFDLLKLVFDGLVIFLLAQASVCSRFGVR